MTVDPRSQTPRSLREYNDVFHELGQMRADGRIDPAEYRRLRATCLAEIARPEMQTRLVDDAPTEDGQPDAFARMQPPRMAAPAKSKGLGARPVLGVAVGVVGVVAAILAILIWRGGT